MVNLLELLIIASEKGANIAKVCRENEDLFNLLIEEKTDDANTRFIRDFKTLADVLIQEAIRHDIQEYFPVLGAQIYGEESNKFENTLGATVEVKVCSCKSDTAKLLEIVLDGNFKIAEILANEVHKKIHISDVNIDKSTIPDDFSLDIENLGIWIDPIDSTAEYIHSKETKDETGLYLTGLPCVTVLIGAFDKSGVPLIGVVNQPFHEKNNSRWEGICYWGVSTPEIQLPSLTIDFTAKNNVITLSKVEKESIKSKLIQSGYKIVPAAGAGYKLLTVITGAADAYIVSQGTTFRWDTCGPHAILRSLGGGIFDYSKAVEGEICELDYKHINDDLESSKIKKYCNKNGLIAVRSMETLKTIINLLKE